MKEVARSGRTVLLVTHQLSAVDGLCTRGIVLDGGQVSFDGEGGEAVDKMLDLQRDLGSRVSLRDRQNRRGTGAARIESIELYDALGRERDIIRAGESAEFRVHVRADEPTKHLEICLIFSNHRGQRLFRLYSKDTGARLPDFDTEATFCCRVDSLNLMPSEYAVSAKLFSGGEDGICLDEIEDAFRFGVAAGDIYGTGAVPGSPQDVLFVRCAWTAGSLCDVKR
jgi:lipopolysaccharide transport system ATP-binding protein